MPESTDLEVRRDVAAMTEDELRRTFSVAKALALSKRFPDAKTADEAFAKILIGRDLGLSPTQALTGLHIVEGKPQIAAVTLAGFVRRSDGYDYAILPGHDDQVCRIEFFETRWVSADTGHGTERVSLGVSEFTIGEAQRAGLVKDKSNWVKWPKNMLFARAMSNGVKWFCPDLMGGVPIYTEGDVIESTATELAAGEGSGDPVGWQGVAVDQAGQLEAVLTRAKDLGHAGLANRATVEMAVNGLARDRVAEFIAAANDSLAAMASTVEDTSDVPAFDEDAAGAEKTEALERRRAELLDQIAAFEDGPDDEGPALDVRAMHDELAAIEAEIGAARNPEQEAFDV